MIGVLFPNEFLVSVNNSCPIWKPKKLLGTTGLIREKERKKSWLILVYFFCNRSLPFMVQCTY